MKKSYDSIDAFMEDVHNELSVQETLLDMGVVQ